MICTLKSFVLHSQDKNKIDKDKLDKDKDDKDKDKNKNLKVSS